MNSIAYKILFTSSVIINLIALPGTSAAEAKSLNWYLPAALNDQNTKITFEVDSTWHTVHGKTSDISGKAWLADEKDTSSVNVLLELPVAKFDTDNESRDEELRDIFKESEFPKVIFSANGLLDKCKPDSIPQGGECTDRLSGTLQIRDVKMNVEIPVTIKAAESAFQVEGMLPIKWMEYHIEDPSIFVIASVEPVANVYFNITLK